MIQIIKLNKKITLITLIFFLMVANIVMFASTVSLSDSIVKMESHTQKLKTENQMLKQKLSSLNAITRIDKIADYLGFTQNSQILDIETFKYVAGK